jgi:hypothetical protein
MNMLIRRLKNLRDQGTEVVFLAHEDIQKVYGRGSAMSKEKAEPVAIKGWPDMPGQRTPDEMCRAADNVFRIRRINGKPIMVANREVLGSTSDFWEVKDRFNATKIGGGLLPFDYHELAKLAMAQVPMLWDPAYIWILYGSFGIGKTRGLLTFPRPIKVFDLDRGTKSISNDVKEIRAKEGEKSFIIEPYDVEEVKEYERFTSSVAACF